MKIVLFLLVSLFTCSQYVHSLVAQQTLRDIYHDIAQNIVSESLKDSVCYNRLAEMCDTYGSRLSGSKSLEQSIDWIVKVMSFAFCIFLNNLSNAFLDLPINSLCLVCPTSMQPSVS